MIFWLALLCGIVGAVGGEWWGLLVGAALGGLLGAVLEMRRRLTDAERQLQQLQLELKEAAVRPTHPAAPHLQARTEPPAKIHTDTVVKSTVTVVLMVRLSVSLTALFTAARTVS